jgi:hypothetical protein
MKHPILSLEESNKKLGELIENKSNYLVSRAAISGGPAITALTLTRQPINPQFLIWVYHNEGFYGTPHFERFAQLYSLPFKIADMQAYWGYDAPGFEDFVHYENYLTPPNIPLIDPSVFDAYLFDEPWTLKLKGKKILIIHSFAETMSKQVLTKDKHWKDKQVLPDAEYIFYKPVQSLGGYGPHSSWYESFDIMCQDISKIDFDVAWVSAGGYGMPLTGFIKQYMGKSAIYVGGVMQILFAIKGKRWEVLEGVTNNYNEFWVRPSEEETPRVANQIEGGCYW